MANTKSTLKYINEVCAAFSEQHGCQIIVDQPPSQAIFQFRMYKGGYGSQGVISYLEIQELGDPIQKIVQTLKYMLDSIESVKNNHESSDNIPLEKDPGGSGTYGSLEYSNEVPFSSQYVQGSKMPISLDAINKITNKYYGGSKEDLHPLGAAIDKPALGPSPFSDEPLTHTPPEPMPMSDLYAGKGRKHIRAHYKALDKSWVELKQSLAKAKLETLEEAPKTQFDESWAKLVMEKQIHEDVLKAAEIKAQIEELTAKMDIDKEPFPAHLSELHNTIEHLKKQDQLSKLTNKFKDSTPVKFTGAPIKPNFTYFDGSDELPETPQAEPFIDQQC